MIYIYIYIYIYINILTVTFILFFMPFNKPRVSFIIWYLIDVQFILFCFIYAKCKNILMQ